jgi:hypothetical protein
MALFWVSAPIPKVESTVGYILTNNFFHERDLYPKINRLRKDTAATPFVQEVVLPQQSVELAIAP